MHVLQNRLFTRNSATSMQGMALDVAATFFPKICGGLSATSRLMLGMGFSKTLRRCGKFQGVRQREFLESTENPVRGKSTHCDYWAFLLRITMHV
ncbi:MAG: hypothetical protein U1D41_14560 [Nitrosomonas sp.]|uniref:hypothetical protein n=1 Tax=Nitrosomonas sp. TaxID=42353 RepID=UPI002ABB58BE|nr:hypothetical protein [Nitrosomonas sp.]MDZ4107349.1 hypothetical protein [Nitrosomonas sp.]